MVTDGLTNREIAAELKLAEKTVRNYVTNILAKVGVRNRTQLAVYVAARRRAG
jgi:two-component system, NarL family, response regulator DevR